ncbi:MAG: ribose-phosphate pyrophosphokinase [Candidatus Roizmanbacteria bacterium]|nr:MAG: ribose-phosphate pyrophosphokinase [Candidatus Roizmanbacteria bacterium]
MLKLFSGTGNPDLSQEVAQLLKISLSASEVVRFENSEVRVRIEEDVKNDICAVIQPIANPTDTNLMEMFLFCDALRRQEAHKVIGIIPYFGYARQDIQHREGECVSISVIIRFLESIGFNKVYTFDLHDEATSGVFSIPFKDLTSLNVLANDVKKTLGKSFNRDSVVVVSPDQGGIERTRNFGRFLYGDDYFSVSVIEKKRDLAHIHQSGALNLFGDVKDKVAILVDDIITSGGTLIHAANLCKEKGAKKIFAAIVHHDLSIKAPPKIQESAIEKVFTTNTVKLKPEYNFEKLHEVSIASIIAEELKTFKNV